MKPSNDQLFAAYQKSQLKSLGYSPKREDFEENLKRYGKLEFLPVMQSWIEENSKAELDLGALMASLNNPTPEIAAPDELKDLHSREAKFLLEIAYGLASLEESSEALNHAVPSESSPKISIKSGVKTRNWRGIVITKTSTKTRSGGFADIWVAGLCGSYQDKDELKAFTQERGGSWNSHECFWYVPLEGKKHIDILENFWDLALEAIAEMPEILQSHQKVFQLSVEQNNWNMNDRTTHNIINWLTKKAKRANSNMSLVDNVPNVVKLGAAQ